MKEDKLKMPINTPNRQLWVGDFDGDGTPNIDDSFPFDKNSTNKVNPEVSVKLAFLNVEETRLKYEKDIKKLQRKLKATSSRVKGTHSAIAKQLGRNLVTLEDMGGLRILKDTRKQVFDEAEKIKKKFKKCSSKVKDNCITAVDNQYKKMVEGKFRNPYGAVHINIKYKGNPYEIQIKSKRFQDLSDRIHPCYKSGDIKCLRKGSKKAENIFNAGG